MKDKADVIRDFNNVVNMTAAELEKWLKSDTSKDAGWSKDDGGESIGHDSGRKIVQILKDNPQKTPDKYTDDHVEHMRKVVSYCKRHLAQEGKINDTKSVEEVKKTKSYASLKNWGHDPLKSRDNGEDDGEDHGDGEGAGVKRAKRGQDGQNKRQKTGKSTKNGDVSEEQSAADDQDTDEEEEAEGDDQSSTGEEDEDVQSSADEKDEEKSKTSKSGKTSSKNGSKENEPKKGETVSWNWGQGQPEGKVEDVKHQKTSIETKKGNTVSRDGTSEDPAVVLDTGKSKAVKLAHELN
ncbi:DNA-binding protein [Pochonia chlamydosporia 170]|uniref:DNA-binding protein n=1 Tax=Pochonia chlamydosporia 170 TaxID=1380566 RepID=A0A179EYT6_METCM|nr:DNA-binding protein [Pochonia chlamydosporia 170]OAQ58341.1 DNA-binding protein [Pochonia chlamydosporia 170]